MWLVKAPQSFALGVDWKMFGQLSLFNAQHNAQQTWKELFFCEFVLSHHFETKL
jgi:hypothetical protein